MAGAGESAQRLGAYAVLAEDLGLVLSTHMVAHPLRGYQAHTWCAECMQATHTHRHTDTNTNIYISKKTQLNTKTGWYSLESVCPLLRPGCSNLLTSLWYHWEVAEPSGIRTRW